MQYDIPWVEKYRPQSLDELVGQTEIVKRLKSYVESRNMPNLLFAGPAGTGKTSAAVALAKELFGNNFEHNFLELNASDERGIDVVRTTIKDFARSLAFNADFKIIFLDESDALTADAQQAMRRTMEKYSKITRFILSANYSSKLIEPIQSRCVIFRFKPLAKEQIIKKLEEIASKESISLNKDALDAIVYVAEGDLRKAINILQASSAYSRTIDADIVYNVASRANPEEIRQMLKSALSKDFASSRNFLNALLYKHGMSGEDVLLQLYKEVLNTQEISEEKKLKIIDAIAEINFRIVEGANERIQLEALLAKLVQL
ncbi:MAG: replication factor C small subunit [Candidatus Iainarchaeum archaeon]|uniref:Replication factor C small subunit n=1 Tax=Candidatus Iainarchaeum sp. TaxID=3101447 RepID=A0A497JIM7_9ARCH|nr:MAG: replication factor C small subunit [Candidatus Diapherotrites archaeon]